MVEAPAGSYWYEDDVVEIDGDRNLPERVAWGELVAQLRNRLELNTLDRAACQTTRRKEHFGILEWAEKTIVDSAQEAGPEFDGERVARGPGRGADLESARIFIQLDDREVVVDREDFAWKPLLSDLDEFEAAPATQSGEVYYWPVDSHHSPCRITYIHS